MDYTEYKNRVMNRFNNSKNVKIEDYVTEVFYEEEFRFVWLATKLKMFSFISYSSIVNEETIKKYSEMCFEYARNNYKGMPRGFQNGFSSFSVLAGENIDEQAIDFVISRPTIHFSAFEMPILYDLNKNSVYFYQGIPTWGKIYYNFIREYINKKFS